MGDSLKPNVVLIRQAFRRLKVGEARFARRFCDLLFASHPEMKRFLLMPSGRRFRLAAAQVMEASLKHLDDDEALVEALAPFAAHLRTAGIRPVHFAAMGETLLATLASLHKDQWTGELARHWILAFQRASWALRQPERRSTPRAG